METKVYTNGYEKFKAEETPIYLEKIKVIDEQIEKAKDEMEKKILEGGKNALAKTLETTSKWFKKECESNADFNKAVCQPWKSIKRMEKHINDIAMKYAKSLGRNGGGFHIDDDIVFDWITDYFFLDDEKQVKEQQEKEAKAKAEKEAREKAEAERKAKAEKEALDELQNDEAYNNATDEEKKKLVDEKVKELIKKAERKAKADERKAKKAAEERAKAVKRLEDAGAITDSTSDTEKEKMIEQTIKKIRKEEREAKKAEKEAKAKKEAERDTSIEANMPEKSAHEIANSIAADFEAQEKAEAEAKPEPSPRDKAIAEATKILESCRADEVIKLYKHSSLEEFSDVELDNLITHKDQVVARYGKVS